MSDDSSMLKLSRKTRLSAEVTYLMLRGAGYAAIFVLSIWLVIAVIAAVGRALPEQSRETPDPTPTSQMLLPTGDLVQSA